MTVIPFPAARIGDEAIKRVLRPLVEEARRQYPDAHAAALAAIVVERKDPGHECPEAMREAAQLALAEIAIELGAEPVRDEAALARTEALVRRVIDEMTKR